jgi:hypothetical protein
VTTQRTPEELREFDRRSRTDPDAAYEVFLSMNQAQWDAMMISSRGGMLLTAPEQEGLGRAIIERIRRKSDG